MDISYENIIELLNKTYISPSGNQAEIIEKWKFYEKNTNLPKILVEIANSEFEKIKPYRIFALSVLKNLIETQKQINEEILENILNLLQNNSDPNIRKISGLILTVSLKFVPNLEIVIQNLLIKYKHNSEFIISLCNFLEDIISSFTEKSQENSIKILLKFFSEILENHPKFPLEILVKIIETFAICIFENFTISNLYISQNLEIIQKLCINKLISPEFIKKSYELFSNYFDKDKENFYKILKFPIKDLIAINLFFDHYDIKLSVCEFLLHILEEISENNTENLALFTDLENNFVVYFSLL